MPVSTSFSGSLSSPITLSVFNPSTLLFFLPVFGSAFKIPLLIKVVPSNFGGILDSGSSGFVVVTPKAGGVVVVAVVPPIPNKEVAKIAVIKKRPIFLISYAPLTQICKFDLHLTF